MSRVMIHVDRLSKRYRLGLIGRTSLHEDLGRWWARMHGRPDPTLRMDAPGARRPSQEGALGGDRLADDAEHIWALRDVAMEVRRGEVLGIIGRNGSGKSTLLKVLSRVTAPTLGCVKIRGRIASLLEVGTGFHPELTGRENVYLNGAILGMGRAEIRKKFDEIVAFSGCGRYIDTPVKRYSSGMYVRLAFAVAAHLDPDILVVDEVLAVGDAEFQKKCIGKMQDVAGHGRTVVFVSHNMAAVGQLCGRVLWLDGGRVLYDGETLGGIQRYLATAGDSLPSRTWTVVSDAPGDDHVRMAAIRVLQDGAPAPSVDINRPCHVEVEFEILSEVDELVTGFHFYNAEGLCLFAHCDWQSISLRPGRYMKRATLPPQLLAEGRVVVLAQFVYRAPHIQQVALPNAASFEAHDSEHPDAIRGVYKGTWPGVVRVPLAWSECVRLREGLHA